MQRGESGRYEVTSIDDTCSGPGPRCTYTTPQKHSQFYRYP